MKVPSDNVLAAAAILAFEKRYPGTLVSNGRKARAIRQTFDFSPTRYFAHLNRVLDAPESAYLDPALVGRLRRIRDRRRTERWPA